MVKIISMVKDEADIVHDWVVYHASIVGYENIHVIDNMSTDGTFEILNSFNIHTYRSNDYTKKGECMTVFTRKFKNEIVIPLDIDEFMVRYDNGTIRCDNLLKTLQRLPLSAVYKMNYVQAQCSKDYVRAPVEATKGVYEDYKMLAKSFFNTRTFRGNIDHGNHFYTPYFFLSPFVLVHFHFRNRNQLLKKIKNNMVGLGYNLNDRQKLQEIVQVKENKGTHHVQAWLHMQDNVYQFPYSSEGKVDLRPLTLKIIELTTSKNVLGVVARYNESLNWMLEPPFNQIKYIVYNKGTNDDFCKNNVVSVVTLPNVGRCDHTFLYHIVQNYRNLDNIVVFLPGSIDIPFKKTKAARIVHHAVKYNRPAMILNEKVNIRMKFANFVIDEWQCIHQDNVHANNERTLTPCVLRPFGKWYDTHFGHTRTDFYSIHSIFSITSKMVLARKYYEYISLLKEISVSSNPEVGHYLERAWGAVFGSGFDFI